MQTLTLLQEVLGDARQSGNELLFFCPFCKHRKRKLSVNTDSICWKCWVCNERGRSIFSLLWRLGAREHCSRLKDAQPLANTGTASERSFEFGLPDEYRSLISHPNPHALAYLRKRGVSKSAVLRHKIGYAQSGRFKDRIILPSFALSGKPNFCTGRAIRGEWLRYLNPETPPGYKKSIVLNELNIDWRRPITLVEGFFDMLRIENATPIFGSVLADDCRLFQEIVMRDATVYVCLDADARKKQLDLIATLNSFDIRAYDVHIQKGDLAEACHDDIASAFSAATIRSRTDLLKERIRSSCC